MEFAIFALRNHEARIRHGQTNHTETDNREDRKHLGQDSTKIDLFPLTHVLMNMPGRGTIQPCSYFICHASSSFGCWMFQSTTPTDAAHCS